MSVDFITIGKILKTQGHRGAVRVLPLTDYPERFQKNSRVWFSAAGPRRELNIEDASPHQKYMIIKFKEIETANDAEELKGGLLEVTRDKLVSLPEGSYYIFDIVGLNVFDRAGKFMGVVSEVLRTGANDVYMVDTEGKPLMIPALKHVVSEIDLAGRRMVVELPEGLVDS